MIDFAFISFAFLAGLVAFFAPCSVVLLPGYVTYYVSKGEDKNLSNLKKVFKGFKFGFFTILGFFTIYGGAGFLIILFGQFIKRFIPWIAILFGIILIFLGIIMLFGKHFSFNLNFFKIKNERNSLYLFGTAYSVASLGCVFPLFLTILLQGLLNNNFFYSFLPLLAYIFGISLVMIITTILIIFFRDFFSRKLRKLLPYFYYISAFVLIVAGFYMLYYQYLLFRY